jgi:VanZ family protein
LSYGKILFYWSSAMVIGVIVEYLQMWMAVGRSAEVLDAMANSAGAVSGIIISRVLHRILA